MGSVPGFLRGLMVAAILLLMAGLVCAQTHRGSCYGSIGDEGGDPLPGVIVTMTGLGAPPVTMVTDARGRFLFRNLKPGLYTIKAVMTGMKTVTRHDIVITAGLNTEIELTISPPTTEESLVPE